MAVVETNHPPPVDDNVFQQMCVDLYKFERPDDIVEIYGRNGQPQHGVDIIVRNDNMGRLICLQCKCREKLAPADLEDELQKTKKFPHKIWRYVFLVTIKPDNKLQDEIIRLQDEYNFQIEIRFWPWIAGAIATSDDLAKKYFQYTITRFIEVEKSPSAVHLVLTVGYSQYSFLVVQMSSFESYAGQDDLVLVTGLQAERKSGFHRLSGGHWTDLFESAIPFRYDAYAVWKWLSQFRSFEELLCNSGERAIEGLTNREVEVIRCAFDD
ncbi:hypothetical protein [Rhizobium leguminosarum]|uniref:hypothetical protein n=1 Tax=Rhizobium leguminosarum TaxID=384 RepID=UPI00036F2BC0|nr:hypothetical protein [Rhizobium leguminosarum]